MSGEVIDIHAHIFPDELASRALGVLSARSGLLPFKNGTESALIESMGEAGIGVSVVQEVATRACQVEVINGRRIESEGPKPLVGNMIIVV